MRAASCLSASKPALAETHRPESGLLSQGLLGLLPSQAGVCLDLEGGRPPLPVGLALVRLAIRLIS